MQPSGQGSSSDQAGIAGTLHQQQRRMRPHDVELLEKRVAQPHPGDRLVGGGGPSSGVSQPSTRSGNRASTSEQTRVPDRIASPCLRMPGPRSRS